MLQLKPSSKRSTNKELVKCLSTLNNWKVLCKFILTLVRTNLPTMVGFQGLTWKRLFWIRQNSFILPSQKKSWILLILLITWNKLINFMKRSSKEKNKSLNGASGMKSLKHSEEKCLSNLNSNYLIKEKVLVSF